MTNLETLLLAMLGNKGGGGEGGTTNYNELDNRPQVNGITLTGNKDSEDLNLVDINMIGVSYGVAALDGEGKVPESQLPPYPNYDTEIQNINKALDDKVNETELLSTISASSTTQIRDSKTVEFDGTGKAVEKLVVEGKTSQDGTPTPSAPVEVKGVGDGGWNIMPFAKKETKSLNGVTIASDGLGTYTLSGTATADTFITFNIDEFVTVKSIGNNGTGCLYLFNNKTFAASSTIALDFMYKSQKVDGWSFTFFNRVSYDYNVLGEKQVDAIRFHISPNITTNFLCKPMMTNDGKTDHEFIPYGKYKIPISVAGKTSNIYLDTPLYDGEILDTEAGQREVRYVWKTIDGSISSLIKQSDANKYGVVNFYTRDLTSDDYTKVKCLQLPNQLRGAGDSATESGFRIESTMTYLRIHQSIATTVDGLKTWLNNNPLKFLVPVSTATKETFDAPEIPTVVGKNTLTVGTDVAPAKIEVTSFGEYYSKVEVDKMLAEKANTSDMIVIRGSVSYDDTLVLNVPAGTYDLTLIQTDSVSVRYAPNKYVLRTATTNGVVTTYFYAISEPTQSRKIESVSIDSDYNVTFKFNTKGAVFTLALHKA